MIVSYIGLPGSGKTYSMSRDCSIAISRGIDVWANYALKGARFFNSIDEIRNVENGIVAIDELNTLLPAVKWQSAKIDHLNMFTQSRHLGLDLLYTTQNFYKVVSTVREITNQTWEFDWVIRPKFRKGIEPNWYQKKLLKWHTAKLFDPSQLMRSKAKPLEQYTFYENKEVYKIYNTKFRIKTPEHLRSKDDIENLDPYNLPQFGEDLELDDPLIYEREDFKDIKEE